MPSSQIRIVKAAIARLGEEVPQSLSEDVDAMIAQEAMWDSIVEEALTQRSYRFATKIRALVVTTDEPPLPWQTIWEMPNDVLDIQDVIDGDGNKIAYEPFEGVIYTHRYNTDTLNLIYTWRPSVERWPADFCGAIEEELLGRLLGAFEERIRALEIRKIAEGKFKLAHRRDLRQKPPQRVNNAPLLRAWYSRSTGRR